MHSREPALVTCQHFLLCTYTATRGVLIISFLWSNTLTLIASKVCTPPHTKLSSSNHVHQMATCHIIPFHTPTLPVWDTATPHCSHIHRWIPDEWITQVLFHYDYQNFRCATLVQFFGMTVFSLYMLVRLLVTFSHSSFYFVQTP